MRTSNVKGLLAKKLGKILEESSQAGQDYKLILLVPGYVVYGSLVADLPDAVPTGEEFGELPVAVQLSIFMDVTTKQEPDIREQYLMLRDVVVQSSDGRTVLHVPWLTVFADDILAITGGAPLGGPAAQQPNP